MFDLWEGSRVFLFALKWRWIHVNNLLFSHFGAYEKLWGITCHSKVSKHHLKGFTLSLKTHMLTKGKRIMMTLHNASLGFRASWFPNVFKAKYVLMDDDPHLVTVTHWDRICWTKMTPVSFSGKKPKPNQNHITVFFQCTGHFPFWFVSWLPICSFNTLL